VTDREGRDLGRLHAFRDITRERELDRMKDEFVSLVSHELRTPLTSIKGHVDLLIDGDAGEVTEEQEEFLDIVKNNSDRLVLLVNDLLDVSRIEAGRINLRVQPVDLASSIDEVAASLRPLMEQKRQSLKLELPANLPQVRADRDRVAQVLPGPEPGHPERQRHGPRPQHRQVAGREAGRQDLGDQRADEGLRLYIHHPHRRHDGSRRDGLLPR
jgi:signal transduction histidine kinase